jgi:hypothetical protein
VEPTSKSTTTTPKADSMLGRQVKHYTILEKIGEGGMGVV